MSHSACFRAYFFVILLVLATISSIPFIGERLAPPTASADTVTVPIGDIHNNIYYIQAGAPERDILVSTSVGELYHLGIDHLPAGIAVTKTSPSEFKITIQNVDLPADQLPASYGIGFNATSLAGPEAHADIILVIEPPSGQHPSVRLDKASYTPGDIAHISVVDPHIDCNVHQFGDSNPPVHVIVAGPGFNSDVSLQRDEYSTNLFRGQLLIGDSSVSGALTATYISSSLCVWPSASETVEDQSSLSPIRMFFNSTIYTAVDDTGASGSTDHFDLTIVDASAVGPVNVQIVASNTSFPGSPEGEITTTHVIAGTLPVTLHLESLDPTEPSKYTIHSTIAQLFNLAAFDAAHFNDWPINITATYGGNVVAQAMVFEDRALSLAVPGGEPSRFTNDTATLQLVDPSSNTDAQNFNEVDATLCSYNHTDHSSVIGGKSQIPLTETTRNSGLFNSGYQLAFVDASFNVNNIPLDPLPAVDERDLFNKSHIRVIINQTTDVVAVLGSQDDCWPTYPTSSDLAGKVHTSFTVEPSMLSQPDSAGRGENVGAWAHANPPLATAAMISCANYGGDQDGDGLCDNWETAAGLKIWYPSGSANYYLFSYVNDPYPNVKHKDMLVEIDYVDNTGLCSGGVSYKPSSTAITNIKNAFNTANIANPDNTKGIKLHIYYASNGGEKINTSCYSSVSAWHNGTGTQYTNYDTIKQNFFGSSTERASTDRGKAKWQAFHYCLFIPKQYQDQSSSGVAELLGNDCVVSLGIGGAFDNSVDEQQGTLMHELGHNLGLYHGGPPVTGNDYNINCKPNYPSVMSYIRQTTNPYSNASLTYSEDAMSAFDSHYTSPFIDSKNPDEPGELQLTSSSALSSVQIVWGVNSGATMPPPANIGKTAPANIDWDNDGSSVFPDGAVGGEVNMLGISGCTSGDTVDDKLSGADDWQYIYNSGNMNFRENNPDSFATGVSMPPEPQRDTHVPVEANTTTFRQTRAQFVNTTNALVQNIPINCTDPAFSSDKPSYDIGDKITITIADSDANMDPSGIDSVDVRVFSDSDLEGLPMIADETGQNTGIFDVAFDTSGSSQSNTINVNNGDDVTIRYTDDCSAEVSVPRDFSFKVGIGHSAGMNVTKGPILAGKKEFEERLVTNHDSVRNLVLNQTGLPSERTSVERAIQELKDLRTSMDGFDGGNATDDTFKESPQAINALNFLTDSIRSLQFALNVPYQKEPFNITSLDLNCDGGVGCIINGYSDTATSTVQTFHIDPVKKRITFHGSGQGDLVLQGPSELMAIKNVQSATTGEYFDFETINGTAILIKDLPYNFKDLTLFYGPDLVSPSKPTLETNDGSPLIRLFSGQQGVISENLTNYQLSLNLTDFWQNYTAIAEVRNDAGVTVFLGYVSGLLEPDSLGCNMCKSQVGTSWTPDEQGKYTVRTFVLSGIENPRILSGVKEVTIQVVGTKPVMISTNKSSYKIGETISVTIQDPGVDNSKSIDTLGNIRVFSDSDRVGETFTATETGSNTGIFAFNFVTTSSPESGQVMAKTGDTVTVAYSDKTGEKHRASVTITDA